MHESFQLLRPQGSGHLVFLCDHASNFIPAELHDLGLPPGELARHIAWDIGAAGVTRALSEMFDAPAILCGTSRLVIDCNRQLNAADLIPEVSDGTVIPGNLDLNETSNEANKADRMERWFWPYHNAIESVLIDRPLSTVISIHSMTPSMLNQHRPWQIALSSHLDRRLTEPMLTALRRPGDVIVGDNQPYNLDPDVDFSIPFHAMRRNLPHLQVEFRQDEIADAPSQHEWASRLARALRESANFKT